MSVSRIWVTRDETAHGPLSTALKSAGLSPVVEPVPERRKLCDARQELALLSSRDWLVLTSAFAVQCLAVDAVRDARVAVVGPATAVAARAVGLSVNFISEKPDSSSLFAQLKTFINDGVICYPRSTLALPVEPWSNVSIVSPAVYETVQRAFDRSVIHRVEAIAITSASAMNFIGYNTLPLASLGPATSAAIVKLGMPVWLEALQPTFEALAQAIAAKTT